MSKKYTPPNLFNLLIIMFLFSACTTFGSEVYRMLLEIQVLSATIKNVNIDFDRITVDVGVKIFELRNSPLFLASFGIFGNVIHFVFVALKSIIKEKSEKNS